MRKVIVFTAIISLFALSGCINKPTVDPSLDIIPEGVESDADISAKIDAELEDTLDEIDALQKELDEMELDAEGSVEVDAQTEAKAEVDAQMEAKAEVDAE